MTRNWETCVAMESKKRSWISILFDNRTRKGRLSGKFLAPKVTYRLRHLFSGLGDLLSYVLSSPSSNRRQCEVPNLTLADSAPAKGTTSPGTKSRLRLRMLE